MSCKSASGQVFSKLFIGINTQYITKYVDILSMVQKDPDLPSSGALLSTKAYAQNLLTGPL